MSTRKAISTFAALAATLAAVPAAAQTPSCPLFSPGGDRPEDISGECQPADFQAFMPRRVGKGATELYWDSAFQSEDGAVLTSVSAQARRNVVSALPAGVRGKTVGTIAFVRPGLERIEKRLRAPRRGRVLLHSGALRVVLHPGEREFLTVTGLPDGTQAVSVVLRDRGTRLVHAINACKMALARGIMHAGSVRAAETHGGHYAC